MNLGKSSKRSTHPQPRVLECPSTAEQRKSSSRHLFFGFCIHQIINWAIAARSLYPNRSILATKIDYKLAYQREHLHWLMALQTCTQLPDNDLALIMLCLTFGGMPCPYKWGVMSETVCDLTNEFIKSNKWNPLTLYTSVQHQKPPQEYPPDNVPFGKAHKLIVEVSADP
jgi:hypothetical protein